MRVKRAAVLEQKELMLPSALHRTDARAAKRAKLRRSQTASKRWMKHLEPLDRFSCGGGAETTDGAFDFRKLWHDRTCRSLA